MRTCCLIRGTLLRSPGHLDCVQMLVRRGADVNQVEDDGWSALMLACLHGHEQVGRFLALNGADKGVVAKDGTSLKNAVLAVRNTASTT
jgi:ankyrin repeat protein